MPDRLHRAKGDTTGQVGDRGVEVESLKGDLAETDRFLTADKELTAKLPESYGSLSLPLDERQKSSQDRCALEISQDMFAPRRVVALF